VTRFITCAMALAALTLLTTDDARAQHAPWTLSVEAEGGGYFPIRAFGKNSTGTEDVDLLVLQPSAKAQASAIAGVGIRLQLPNPSMSLRLQAYRTLGGEIEGRTPACDILRPGDVRAERWNCADNFTEEYSATEVIARLQFKTVAADARLRPTVDMGLGLRQYSFGGMTGVNRQPCSTFLEEAQFICENADDLTADQTQPVLLFGLGLEYSTSWINPFARFHVQVSPYGGNARGEEEGQQDVLGSIGFSINVR